MHSVMVLKDLYLYLPNSTFKALKKLRRSNIQFLDKYNQSIPDTWVYPKTYIEKMRG